MMLHSVILFFVILTVSGSATDVSKCTKDTPLPIFVNIEGCETMPCDLVKGTTPIIDVQFKGTHDAINSMTAEARATVIGMTVPYVLPADIADVCSNLVNETSCPIDKDKDAIYRVKFPVDNSYPEILIKLEISAVDDDTAESVACFVVDVKVKKAISRSSLQDLSLTYYNSILHKKNVI